MRCQKDKEKNIQACEYRSQIFKPNSIVFKSNGNKHGTENKMINSFPLAYLLHFVGLLLTAYFVFILYKTRAENFVFKQFSTKTMLVIGSLLLVYLASSELMLHTVAISGKQNFLHEFCIK